MTRSLTHHDYTVGWVSALPIELAAAQEMLDEQHDDLPQPDDDNNVYTLGRIGDHNVAIACLPAGQTGTNSAAAVAMQMKSTFRSLRFGLMVGIGGGVPSREADIRLGDIVVGQPGKSHGGVVQYDFGKSTPTGIERTGFLNTPPPILLSAVAKLQAYRDRGRSNIHGNVSRLVNLPSFSQERCSDRLFRSSYEHNSVLRCDSCHNDMVVKRKNREDDMPRIFYGCIASGNQVMRDGRTRDKISSELGGVFCFEMEAAGLMNTFPCLVIRGICDYSDSHKDKTWQPYAAGTAAAYAKEILSLIPGADVAITPTATVMLGDTRRTTPNGTFQHHDDYIPARDRIREHLHGPRVHWSVPFGRNRDFVGREAILDQLLQTLPPSADDDDCQRTALVGLGGIGKTQIALEASFRVRDQYPECSVFWVPAVDTATFDNAYREIGLQLKVEGLDNEHADVRSIVKSALGDSTSSWLLIIDNADDMELLFEGNGTSPLVESLPFNRKGSILFTTRNHDVAVRLDVPTSNILVTDELSRDMALKMLSRHLRDTKFRESESVHLLLDFLADLPLAIRQASAYMSKTGVSIAKYLQYCQSSDVNLIKVLSKDFEDRGRYKTTSNPIATTWLISFAHILRDNKLAADYLEFMCFLAEKDIPATLLPPADNDLTTEEDGELERDEAIGILKGYAFISERAESGSYDMHRLIRLTMRNYLKQEKRWDASISGVIQRLSRIYPYPDDENREVWMKYLPHARTAVASIVNQADAECESKLVTNIGHSLYFLGMFQECRMNHQRALELRQNAFGERHPDTMENMHWIANVLSVLGFDKEARDMHQRTYELRVNVLGEQHVDTLASMNNLSITILNLGKLVEAERILRELLIMSERMHGKRNDQTRTTMRYLAVALARQGKHNEAELLSREALKLTEAADGKEHPNTLSSMHDLADLLFDQKLYDEAEKLHRQVLMVREKRYGRSHHTVFDSLRSLANVLRRQKKFEEATQCDQDALDGYTKLLGKEHPSTVTAMNGLANLHSDQGNFVESEDMHRKVVMLSQKVLGPEHPETLMFMYNLALDLGSLGRSEDASKLHKQVFEMRQRILGPGHPFTIESRTRVDWYRERGLGRDRGASREGSIAGNRLRNRERDQDREHERVFITNSRGDSIESPKETPREKQKRTPRGNPKGTSRESSGGTPRGTQRKNLGGIIRGILKM